MNSVGSKRRSFTCHKTLEGGPNLVFEQECRKKLSVVTDGLCHMSHVISHLKAGLIHFFRTKVLKSNVFRGYLCVICHRS